jgi:hypothetical protein
MFGRERAGREARHRQSRSQDKSRRFSHADKLTKLS